LPSAEQLTAIAPGDLVKLIFRSIPPSDNWGAERMWLTVTSVDGHHLEGRLESTPDDMPSLHKGDLVQFERGYVATIVFNQQESRVIPPDIGREYWERCMVDECVLYDGVPVWYVYRETPDLDQDGDEYPDSGWRIRGDPRGSDEQVHERKAAYVALGAVLNRDDTFLHLIDEPVGSAFIRDFNNNEYKPESCTDI
jgi:hypothetical protein